jgi:amyloid beta precursor protein binding protein 1
MDRMQMAGVEIHTTAALMGGIVAQEAIKIITHQYVPLQNTLLFDGIQSGSASFVL